jgi:hypothetical protein
MKKSELRQIIREEIKRVNESSYVELFNKYMADKITLGDLVDSVGDISKVATKSEIQKFLKNDFMVGWMSQEKNISKSILLKQAKELLKIL